MACVAYARDLVEAYISEPLPPGFQVVSTELQGPKFADANGHTLYTWPLKQMRSGITGEAPGKPTCENEKIAVTDGIMSPYPPGLALPNAETRPTCTDMWPPVYAAEDAEGIDNWSIVRRTDGSRQWAYQEQPVYTYVRDSVPGEILGSHSRQENLDAPAYRVAIGPMPMIPPGFAVSTQAMGRMLTTDANRAVYVHDQDTAESTICYADCTRTWLPMLAPALARPQGEWGIFNRSPGVLQWTYRGKPLYTYALDSVGWGVEGADVPGWSNVYTQIAPAFPANFTVQKSLTGEILADSRGMTIYRYACVEDTMDQLLCDHPGDIQVYRIAICGAGEQDKCLENWPYVEAMPGEISKSNSWNIVAINPKTGHQASPGQKNAIQVWAFRDRPVYTFADDRTPGDTYGSSVGETRGQKNGLVAFILRNDFVPF